jgi:hypothetical protein
MECLEVARFIGIIRDELAMLGYEITTARVEQEGWIYIDHEERNGLTTYDIPLMITYKGNGEKKHFGVTSYEYSKLLGQLTNFAGWLIPQLRSRQNMRPSLGRLAYRWFHMDSMTPWPTMRARDKVQPR